MGCCCSKGGAIQSMCSNFAIYSQDNILGLDDESGENESYGASNHMELEMPASTEIEETTSPSILDRLRALKRVCVYDRYVDR